MNAPALEAFLALLYTDAALREAFVEQPESVARSAGLDDDAVSRLAQIDREGLVLAAASFASKRAAHAGQRKRPNILARLRRG